MQVLLDHQLMDMAWSDNLIDCEENLLRVSNHLQQQSPNSNTAQQMAELYGILLHDREKLNHRFSELSVKSSLSEFVVNSRQLLDINAVRIAAEAILKNEKPIPAQGDHSSESNLRKLMLLAFYTDSFTVPVDHTFFLANFCTASLASSTMTSFLPKQTYVSSGSANTSGTSVARYDPTGSNAKKINGTQGPPQLSLKSSTQLRATVAGGTQPSQPPPTNSVAAAANGIGISDGLVVPGNGNGGPPGSGGNSFSGIYNDAHSDGLDYLGQMGSQQAQHMANGMFGQHELVAAISQITAADQSAVAAAAHAAHAAHAAQQQQQNKQPAYNKAKKYWSAPVENSVTGGSANQQNAGVPEDKTATKPNQDSVENKPGPPRGLRPNAPPVVPRPRNEMSIPNNDSANSDSLSSTSEDVNAASASGEIGDNGKPLSFARIASLNLEKQAVIHRSQKPMSAASEAMLMNTNPAASMASMTSMMEMNMVAQMNQHQMAAAMGHHGHFSANPATMAAAAAAAAMAQQLPMVQLPPTNNPRFFFDIAMDGKRLGRAIIEVQASLAPKMAENFHLLATAEKGFGYRGCQFFQAWRNESVICGDWEHNSGRGGRAAIDEGPLFTPDETKLPCIRGAVGMRRMSKKHSSLNQV